MMVRVRSEPPLARFVLSHFVYFVSSPSIKFSPRRQLPAVGCDDCWFRRAAGFFGITDKDWSLSL